MRSIGEGDRNVGLRALLLAWQYRNQPFMSLLRLNTLLWTPGTWLLMWWRGLAFSRLHFGQIGFGRYA